VTARERVLDLEQRLSRTVMSTLPGRAVRRWAAFWGPLTRYGGRTRPGAAAFGRAVRLVVEAQPRPLPPGGTVSIPEIAARVGRSEGDVERWAARGLLGPPADAGPPPVWGREGLERARLVAYLLLQGVSDDEMARAAAAGHLPLMVLERTLAGRGTLTATEVAERAGVGEDFADRLWHALGMPRADPGDRVYGRREVEALRLIRALQGAYEEDDLVDAATVVGRAMAQIAAAEVELFRRGIGSRLAESGAGELEWALRAAAAADLMRRPGEVVLTQAYRRHLEAAARAESVERIEAATGGLPGQVDVAVAFADLVGFTEASEHLSPLEVGEIAGRLLALTDPVVAKHGVRVVKTIGDAVMIAGRDVAGVGASMLALVAAVDATEGMPPLRAGVAFGPVLRRHGDYFGRTVNIASRLCAAAPARSVLLHVAAEVDLGALDGLRVADRMRLRLRGIDHPVEALRLVSAR